MWIIDLIQIARKRPIKSSKWPRIVPGSTISTLVLKVLATAEVQKPSAEQRHVSLTYVLSQRGAGNLQFMTKSCAVLLSLQIDFNVSWGSEKGYLYFAGQQKCGANTSLVICKLNSRLFPPTWNTPLRRYGCQRTPSSRRTNNRGTQHIFKMFFSWF